MARTAEKDLTPYQRKLLDPRWQKCRLKVLERAAWACEDCGAETLTLEVHHRIYLPPPHDPWDYPPENFVACCWRCHNARELVVKQSRMIFQIIPPGLAKSVLDKLATYRGDLDAKMLELNMYLALDPSRPPVGFEEGDGI